MTKIDEAAPSGAQRYYMHAQAHDQATKKYAVSAKSGISPEMAKSHRKLGRLHKQIAAALNQIAGVHTTSDFNRSMQKKATSIANKKMNEGSEYNSVTDTLHHHGWQFESGGSDHAAFVHPKHPGHVMSVEDGHWEHHDHDDDDVIKRGKSDHDLHKHLKKFHDVKEDFEGEDDMPDELIENKHMGWKRMDEGRRVDSSGQMNDEHHEKHDGDITKYSHSELQDKHYFHHGAMNDLQDEADAGNSGRTQHQINKEYAHHEKQASRTADEIKKRIKSGKRLREDYVNSESVEDEDEHDNVNEHLDNMVSALLDQEPGAFATAFSGMMAQRALDRIEELKVGIAQETFDEPENVQEEILDEISKEKTKKYRRAADDQRSKIHPTQPGSKKGENRHRGSHLAFDKLTGQAKVNATGKFPTQESFEQIDELSRKTLTNYAEKAALQVDTGKDKTGKRRKGLNRFYKSLSKGK